MDSRISAADVAGEPESSPAVPPRHSVRGRQSALQIPGRVRVGFLAPAVVVLLAIIIWPVIDSVWLSLRNANGTKFVGLKNYGALFSDPATLTALKNNVIWVVTAPTLACALGLMFALLAEKIKWASAFKVVI